VKTVNGWLFKQKTVGGYKHRYRLDRLRRAEMLANVQSELINLIYSHYSDINYKIIN